MSPVQPWGARVGGRLNLSPADVRECRRPSVPTRAGGWTAATLSVLGSCREGVGPGAGWRRGFNGYTPCFRGQPGAWSPWVELGKVGGRTAFLPHPAMLPRVSLQLHLTPQLSSLLSTLMLTPLNPRPTSVWVKPEVFLPKKLLGPLPDLGLLGHSPSNSFFPLKSLGRVEEERRRTLTQSQKNAMHYTRRRDWHMCLNQRPCMWGGGVLYVCGPVWCDQHAHSW
jgi:hypothetical protein